MSCSKYHDYHDDCCKRKEKVRLNAEIEFDFDDFCRAVRRCDRKFDDKCDHRFDDDRKRRGKCCW